MAKSKYAKDRTRTIEELRQMQALPLEAKIVKTQKRIKDWYDHYDGEVYLAFSGGIDSTVLRHLIKTTVGVYDVPSVFVNTGLEFPEIQKFVKACKERDHDVEILYPTMNFVQVIQKYGYPAVSKEVSRHLDYATKAIAEGREKESRDYQALMGYIKDKYGNKSMFNCDKWKYLLNADFKCSASCCDIMKKSPSKKYESETGRVQYVGTMAEESRLRVEKWLQSGCNAFDNKRPTSAPMSFWTHQDVLQYLVETKIPYCSVYGDIIQDAAGKYYTTGVNRTGCIFCMYGAHLEKPVNRFQYLYFSHPRQYQYCIGGGEYNESGTWVPNKEGLGLGHVMDEVGINYKPTKRLF